MLTAEQNDVYGQIEVFEYPATPYSLAAPAWAGFNEESESEVSGLREDEHFAGADETAADAEIEKGQAEETQRAFEAGRERGRQEEREAQTAAHKAAEEQRARQAAELIAAFAQERDRYLHTVEHEVVKLALAIAARILRREAQMDPLLLTGAVRVALGQLSATTEVRLRVPPGELELWSDAISLLPNLALKPVVVAGEGMRLGDCIVETALGSVDLGIRSQLGEIERGFFDRADGGRSGAAARTNAGSPAHAEDAR